jgi:hypothetical protein
VGAELFRADRRTDVTKLIVAFRNYANALKESQCSEMCPNEMYSSDVSVNNSLSWLRMTD